MPHPPFNPPADGPVCIALSGGLDSTALLHALSGDRCVRRDGLRAIHVHHGLHAAADSWADHCRATCAALDVPIDVVHVDITAHAHLGAEGAARAARYAVFAQRLVPGERLALAHHRDDQAETFVLRALRASGVDGLGAMRARAPFAGGVLWRPWLGIPREHIRAYAAENRLTLVQDPSNGDTAFDRNFLRHRVLPGLRGRWPHVDAALARAAALAADAATLLDAADADLLSLLATDDPATLDLGGLKRLPEARRARLLRRWVASLDLPPLPARAIAQLEAEVLYARPDAEAAYRWHGTRLSSWRDRLHASREGVAAPVYPSLWDGRLPLRSDQGDVLELRPAAALPAPVSVRSRAGGERIRLPGRTHRHALKDLLQARAVAPWHRVRLPLLFAADGELLAAGDLVVSATLRDMLRPLHARLAWSPARGLVRATAD
ncbi:tRNA lysidine(34) synthetase TilS [Lysobacter humi (ex Lee et al. 2017)]